MSFFKSLQRQSKFNTASKALLSAGAIALAANSASAILTFDLRALTATGGATVVGPKSVIVDPGTGVTSTVTFGLFAVVTGLNNTIEETFQSSLSSVASFASTGGVKAIRGNLSSVSIDPNFQTGAFFAGQVVDLNGDGDLDVGGPALGATTVTGNFINIRSASATGALPGVSTDVPSQTAAGRAFQYGTVTFTISGLQALGSDTHLNFLIPTFVSAVFNAQRASYATDGTTKNGGTALAPTVFAGTDILISVPEPSAFGMVLLGAMGLVGFRRFGDRHI